VTALSLGFCWSARRSAGTVIARRPKADVAIQEPQGALRSPGSPRPCGLAMTIDD
jgi:hypothetical protein